MAEPVRKLPAAGETETFPASADPFRYGTRWRRVRLPNGQVTEQPIPLTPEDLLDPELGDEVTQSGPHSLVATTLFDLLTRWFAAASLEQLRKRAGGPELGLPPASLAGRIGL